MRWTKISLTYALLSVINGYFVALTDDLADHLFFGALCITFLALSYYYFLHPTPHAE